MLEQNEATAQASTPEAAAEQRKRRTIEELAIRFTYHPPKGDQVERYQALRDVAHAVARAIVETTPESREQSLALTHLEQAVMFANSAIARRE